MLFKTKIRLLGEVRTISHANGGLLVAAYDEIEKTAGQIRRLRDVGARELVAEMEGGWTLRVDVVSTHKLPERKRI